MALLFAGSAPEEFGGVVNETTSATYIDTAYTQRGCTMPYNVGWTANVNATPSGKMWFHIRLVTGSTASSGGADGQYFFFKNSVGTSIAGLDVVNGTVFLEIYEGGAAFSAAKTMANNTAYIWDFSYEVVSGVATFEWYENGALVRSISQSGASTLPEQWDWTNADAWAGGTDFGFSEVIIRDNDESTVGLRLAQLIPDADGNYTAFTGGTYLNLQENDGARLTGTTGDQQSVTFDNYGGASPTAIQGVLLKCFAFPALTGPQSLGGAVRISSVDYDETDVALPANGLAEFYFAQNPATVASWTTTEVNALEGVIEAKV